MTTTDLCITGPQWDGTSAPRYVHPTSISRLTLARDALHVGGIRPALGTLLGTSPPPRFVSRAAWGARPPRQRSSSITPQNGGTALHYEGPKAGTFDHAQCAGRVRGIQRFHMDSRGWADIAYSALVCQHGYIYEGRWLFTRTAANGTDHGNQNYYAICGMLGEGDPLTEPMKVAYNACIAHFRSHGRAGTAVKGHRALRSTECPGELVTRWIADGRPTAPAPAPAPTPAPAPAPAPKPSAVSKATQAAVRVTVDGYWGPATDRAVTAVRAATRGTFPYGVRVAQKHVGTTQDGIWGPASKTALKATVNRLQGAWGVTRDGVWGPNTDAAYKRARSANYIG